MSTLKSIRSDSEELVVDFALACDEIVSAKFIIAEKKISTLLQIIASSSRLYGLIQRVMQPFDFLQELKNVIHGKEIILPSSRSKRIALIFCLLYSFDVKKIDLQEFIHHHFESDNVNDEFSAFGSSIVTVFQNDVLAALRGEIDVPSAAEEEPLKEEKEPLDAETEQLKNDILSFGDLLKGSETVQDTNEQKSDYQSEQSDEKDSLDNVQLSDLLLCIREITDRVNLSADLGKTEKDEILLVCEAFENAVKFNYRQTIKIMYIGLKNTIAVSPIARQLSMQTDNLQKIIEESGL